MPLPKLEPKPGVTEYCTGGKGFDDIRVLLRDLHEGVLELGVGKCDVLAHDEYKREPPRMGFDLCHESLATHQGDSVRRVWHFMITMEDFKRSAEMLHPRVREAMERIQGRQRLARMLQGGVHPLEMGDRLADPAVIYIRRKLVELGQKADQAQAEAHAQKERPPVHRGLTPDPATIHFFTQYEMSALEKLVADLELGKHLG